MKNFSIPGHYDPKNADQVYKIDYQRLANDATAYKKAEGVTNSATDKFKIALMPIDMQNTFCIPDYELAVMGAPKDTSRLVEFIYRNLGRITTIFPTMDTHRVLQIFHPAFFLDANGEMVAPNTTISNQDLVSGKYQLNPAVAPALHQGYSYMKKYVLHYTQELEKAGKYQLTIWPYHAMLGGIGHALVSVLEEALHFHGIARCSEVGFEIKGGNSLTENYSVLSPEILTDQDHKAVADKKPGFLNKLLLYDMLVIAGQAKSHCVANSISDLLTEIQAKDPALAKKVYLLEDCTSPVVIPGVVDFTDQGNQAFDRFKNAGMHLVKSTTPINQWPDVDSSKLV
ncbi:MAG: isochorismatase [Candidatus Peribacteria bacterium]|jgi:nicotinamidase-related amidase|nr:isochorismatase [Candidatus Peribacteria bacterium]